MSDKIYVVMGESGSGKDTLVNRMMHLYGMTRVDSYTTRPRRDLQDRHRFEDSFTHWAKWNPNVEVVAYTEYNGYQYWTTSPQIDESDFVILDPAGVDVLKQKYHGTKSVKVIYISVPVMKRFERMLKRGDGLFHAAKRIAYDMAAFRGAAEMADYIVSDGTVEDMAQQIVAYVNPSRN